MAETKVIHPIAFWKTRSFWFGWVPAALTGLDSLMQVVDTPAAVPVANMIAAPLSAVGFGVSGEDVSQFMKAISPLYAFIIAHQRRGINRPYVASEAKESAVIQILKDGREAFDRGKALGDALKKR